MDCLTLLKNRYADRLDEDTLLKLFEEAKRERAQLAKKISSVGDLEEKLLERLQGRVADAGIIAKAHRRAAMLQLTKRLEAFDFVMQNFHGREEEGLSALIVGSNRAIKGARSSTLTSSARAAWMRILPAPCGAWTIPGHRSRGRAIRGQRRRWK